jgi:hypothetical protein
MAGWLEVYRIWIEGRPQTLPLDELEIPGNAAGAVAWLSQAQHAFAARVESLDESDRERVLRTYYGEHRSIENLVHGMTLEAYHHSAEIGVLRDLHRGYARLDLWPEDIPPREA